MWIGKNLASGWSKGRGKEDNDIKKHSPTHKGVLCRFCMSFYTVNFSHGAMFFQANLSPNKLSRRVFLEQKKLTRLLASQQVSIAEIQ